MQRPGGSNKLIVLLERKPVFLEHSKLEDKIKDVGESHRTLRLCCKKEAH